LKIWKKALRGTKILPGGGGLLSSSYFFWLNTPRYSKSSRCVPFEAQYPQEVPKLLFQPLKGVVSTPILSILESHPPGFKQSHTPVEQIVQASMQMEL